MQNAEITLPFNLQLKDPIVIKNTSGEEVQRIEKLVFQNPLNAGAVENMELPTQGQELRPTMGMYYPMLAHMTGQPINYIRKLSIRDVSEAVGVVNHFLADGQMTGEAS